MELVRKGFEDEEITPIWRDAFLMDAWTALYERRNGTIIGFTIFDDRVSGIHFRRDADVQVRQLCARDTGNRQ